MVASMMHDPQIVFLDEPTAGVAPASRDKFWRLIRLLAEQGKTIFVTTHYMDEAENCNRIALMRSGELIALDSPENLKSQTFKQKMYLIKTTSNEARAALLAYQADWFSMFTPYGLNYHALFKNGVDENAVCREITRKYGSIEQISPSLEDVFVQLVEGTNR